MSQNTEAMLVALFEHRGETENLDQFLPTWKAIFECVESEDLANAILDEIVFGPPCPAYALFGRIFRRCNVANPISSIADALGLEV